MEDEIITCPHCGNETVQEIKYNLNVRRDVFDSNNTYLGKFDFYFYLTECKTCKEITLLLNSEAFDNPYDLRDAIILYPSAKKDLDESIPKIIKDIYGEAKRIEKKSPSAFVILVRKALEYICKDQKAKGVNLKEKINYLAKQNIIPDNLAKIANTLRFLGNISAHASNFKVSTNEIQIIDDLFLAIIEYVYIAPQKLKNLAEKFKISN